MPGDRAPRLDQLLAGLGFGSRAEVRDFIAAGRVEAAGFDSLRPEMRIDPALIRFDGEPLEHPAGLVLALHKPVGFVCSHSPGEGPTIFELLPASWLRRSPRIESVGRLDRDTSGLLILTDQHELIHAWTSPRRHIPKVYEAELAAEPTREMAEVFAAGGLLLPGESKPCLPAEMEIVDSKTARLTLHEGRYHQVRRMFAAVGAPVERLARIQFGRLKLAELGLAPGEFRMLRLDGSEIQ